MRDASSSITRLFQVTIRRLECGLQLLRNGRLRLRERLAIARVVESFSSDCACSKRRLWSADFRLQWRIENGARIQVMRGNGRIQARRARVRILSSLMLAPDKRAEYYRSNATDGKYAEPSTNYSS